MSFFIRAAIVCFCCKAVWAAEPDSFRIRVAVLRNSPSFKQAFRSLCEREYSDTVRIVQNRNGSYDAINSLDVEDFLIGVIGREMSPDAPLEALKAQAVAARSHALYQATISKEQAYDLVANVSQAYLGKAELSKNVVLAIESTRGEVLCYEGNPIPAFFHESCGGHTESAASVWQSNLTRDKSVELKLPATVPCPSCSHSGSSKWSYQISSEKFQELLKQAGIEIGASPTVSIENLGPGGHALTLQIHSDRGDLSLSAEKLRSILGYSDVRSTRFIISRETLEKDPPQTLLVFKGEGYGHGVGLCQRGAQEMAEHKSSYREILGYYFPNTTVQSYSSGTFLSTR